MDAIFEKRLQEAKLKLKAGYYNYQNYALVVQEIKTIRSMVEEEGSHE